MVTCNQNSILGNFKNKFFALKTSNLLLKLPKMTALERDSKENHGRLECQDSLPNIGIPESDSKECDYVPKEVLLALTRVSDLSSANLLEAAKKQTELESVAVHGKKRPSNVWHHRRREKLKHLTDDTICICGAGRDISFLYDVPKYEKKIDKPSKIDISILKGKMEKKDPKAGQFPNTLIPEEFHLVKNQGAKNLEFKDEEFKTYLQEHAKHMVQFPSLKPNSRYEVVQLRNTMIDMLDKAGINDLEVEVKGPTQIHNLLELIKKEQNIYNIIFHELIRQVSVDCLERGDLLAEIRKRYSDLLSRVPNQIKSLHQEVIAQRALDRRLTEELFSFKNSLNTLTMELAKVKEHDSELAREVDSTRKALKIALSEAAKNSNILTEYHELYELQRERLEKQVTTQIQEKEMWCTATYNLAIKVIKECDLTTAKKLVVSEKMWAKIAQHCAIFISDQDTVLLAKIQEIVNKWKDQMEKFYQDISKWEENSKEIFPKLRAEMESKFENFKERILYQRDPIKIIPAALQKEMYDTFYEWDEVLSAETQNYDGIVSLSRLEDLVKILKLQKEWEDLSFLLLDRHTPSENQTAMLKTSTDHMNEVIIKMKDQYNVLLTGDNGAAGVLLSLNQKLSFWLPKLNLSILGKKELTNNDVDQLTELDEEMLKLMDNFIEYFGMPNTLEKRQEFGVETRVSVYEVMHSGEHWFTVTSNVIDSQDAKLIEDVNHLHMQMVMWICNILLRLCHDHPSTMQEAKEALYATCPTPEELLQQINSMFPQVIEMSAKISRSFSSVTQMADYFGYDSKVAIGSSVKLIEQGYGDGTADLERMQNECSKWTDTAQLLISQVLQQPVNEVFPNFPQSRVSSARETMKEETVEQSIHPESETPIANTGQEKDKQVEILISQEEASETTFKDDVQSKSGESQEDKATERLSSTEDSVTVEEEEVEEEVDEEEVESSKEGLLLTDTSEPDESEDQLSIFSAAKEEPKAETSVEFEEQNSPDIMQVVGDDGNTHVQTLEYDKSYVPDDAASFEIENIPDIKRAYVALANVRKLQKQLLVTEERAQKFEERAEKAENELITYEERIRSLEKQLVDCKGDPVAYLTINTNEPAESSLHAPKSSTGGKSSKKAAGKNVKSKKK